LFGGGRVKRGPARCRGLPLEAGDQAGALAAVEVDGVPDRTRVARAEGDLDQVESERLRVVGAAERAVDEDDPDSEPGNGDPAEDDQASAAVDAQGFAISGTVFVDANPNGPNGLLDPGEAGVSGVVVRLLNSSGSVVATTTTSPTGTYSFTDQVPGNYTVVETQPSGFGSSTPDSLNVTLTPSGLTGVNFGETLTFLWLESKRAKR